MSEPFLAEIRIFGFNFNPRGWAQCDGQILPINQNQSLYSLLGTTYGGDGRTSFALPELRGRTPIHTGSSNGVSHPLGQKGGEETHVLSANETPQHTHQARASSANAATGEPTDNLFAVSSLPNVNPFAATGTNPDATMDSRMVANAGGSQGHPNMQPYIALNYCIALQGLFPSRN